MKIKPKRPEFSKLFTQVLLTIIFLLCAGCGGIYQTGFVPIPDQLISNEIEIGSEWVEITAPQPLKPLGKQYFRVFRLQRAIRECSG